MSWGVGCCIFMHFMMRFISGRGWCRSWWSGATRGRAGTSSEWASGRFQVHASHIATHLRGDAARVNGPVQQTEELARYVSELAGRTFGLWMCLTGQGVTGDRGVVQAASLCGHGRYCRSRPACLRKSLARAPEAPAAAECAYYVPNSLRTSPDKDRRWPVLCGLACFACCVRCALP